MPGERSSARSVFPLGIIIRLTAPNACLANVRVPIGPVWHWRGSGKGVPVAAAGSLHAAPDEQGYNGPGLAGPDRANQGRSS
jgi:hypothetical protein